MITRYMYSASFSDELQIEMAADTVSEIFQPILRYMYSARFS